MADKIKDPEGISISGEQETWNEISLTNSIGTADEKDSSTSARHPLIQEIRCRPQYSRKPFKSVGIYTRISTDRKEQVRSIGSQVSGLIDELSLHHNWMFYDIYVDVQSGRSTEDRRGFQRMMCDAENGKIDVVMVKSASRLGRNTVDILNLVRSLKARKVAVYMVTEKIMSFDKDAELAISLAGAVAQGESEAKSGNIKWGLKRSAQNPDSPIYNRPCYGYRQDQEGNLIIEESEAENVRKIFSLYLEGYSILKIRKFLSENHILSPRGNENWSKRSIDTLLSNEKYAGDVILSKTFTAEYPSKKRVVNVGQADKYEQVDHHPAIISHEIFRKVQEEKVKRSNVVVDENGDVHRSQKKYSAKTHDYKAEKGESE